MELGDLVEGIDSGVPCHSVELELSAFAPWRRFDLIDLIQFNSVRFDLIRFNL